VTLEEQARELGLRPHEAAAVELEVAFVGAVAAELLALRHEPVDLRLEHLDRVLEGVHVPAKLSPVSKNPL
jgi:hypothetical protein